MGRMVRTTVIGLLKKDVTFEDIQAFVDEKAAERALAGFKTVRGISLMENGEQRRHIKFSRLSEMEKLDHRWSLSISHEFQEAGYGDVAWKFTEVDGQSPDAENTTVSIHPDLFRACLAEDEFPRHD
jgi:hypothetical protein